MLSYMYSGWNEKEMYHIAHELYQIAHRYGVYFLMVDSEESILVNITDVNICETIRLAHLTE